MFLNEDFIKVWEELSELNEAKADTQNLINFAGEELATKFLAIKNKLKAPENDLYYWIKNSAPEELEAFLREIESTKSKTQAKKEVSGRGAELVCSSEHWNVYHITTYEAAQAYGRDTKWCITGINNWGDKYWNEYKDKGVEFYFLITKENYDPRAYDSKYAIAIYSNKNTYEAFDQKDGQIILEDIKYINEIEIPEVDLWSLESAGERCSMCNELLFNGDGREDSFGNYYCDTCWDDCFG